MRRFSVGSVITAVVLVGLFGSVTTVALWASLADAPWEPEPATPTPRATTVARSFTAADAMGLTQRWVAERPFPQGTNWVRCVKASFRANNHTWVVTCEFRAERDDEEPLSWRTYLFDDRTGEVR